MENEKDIQKELEALREKRAEECAKEIAAVLEKYNCRFHIENRVAIRSN